MTQSLWNSDDERPTTHQVSEPWAHRLWIQLIVASAATILVIGPIAWSGYMWDDQILAQLDEYLTATDQSFWKHWWDGNAAWRDSNGRFFPVGLLVYQGVHMLPGELLAYKLVVIGMIVVNAALLVGLLRTLGLRDVVIQSTLLLAVSLQVRDYYDPILAYATPPAYILLLLASFIFLVRFTKSGRPLTLALAFVLWTLTVLSYEVTLVIALALPLAFAVMRVPRRRFAVAALAFAIPVIATGATIMQFRQSSNNTASVAYTSNFDLQDLKWAFAKQIVATAPLSYGTLGDHHDRGARPTVPYTFSVVQPDSWLRVIGAGVLGGVFGASLFSARLVRRRQAAASIVLGTALIAFPALTVAQTRLWQLELKAGLGYVPVYFQYFGLALLGAGVASIALPRLRRWRVLPLIAVLVGVAMGVGLEYTSRNNGFVVDANNRAVKFPVAHLEHAARDGVLRDARTRKLVPIGSARMIAPQVTTCQLSDDAGFAVGSIPSPHFPCPSAANDGYLGINILSRGRADGTVLVTELDGRFTDNEAADSWDAATSHRFRAWVHSKDRLDPQELELACWWVQQRGVIDGERRLVTVATDPDLFDVSVERHDQNTLMVEASVERGACVASMIDARA